MYCAVAVLILFSSNVITFLQEPPLEEKPTKEEYAVAKYIRDNVPNKKTKFMHHPVQYFTAGRAVDALLDSPWASGEKKHPLLFTDRQSVVDFLDTSVYLPRVRVKYRHATV